jgi:hypothetical protein
MIPDYLKNHLINIKEKKYETKATIVSSSLNSNLEIYYYGELINKRVPFIIDSDLPCLIVAKDPLTNEMFTLFDAAKHGYDNMFSMSEDDVSIYNENDLKERELVKYEKFSGEIEIFLGYQIDYEAEKDDYEFTKEGHVKLVYGTMEWEKAKSIGYDWICIQFKKGRKKFLNLELA